MVLEEKNCYLGFRTKETGIGSFAVSPAWECI